MACASSRGGAHARPDLRENQWANGVPVYSFDAMAMLSQHIIAFGLDDPCLPDAYCHGWGAGLVPLTQRHLMGLAPLAPGWAKLAIEPPVQCAMAFKATVPTCRGKVEILREQPGSPVVYRVPSGIDIVTVPSAGVVVEREGEKRR